MQNYRLVNEISITVITDHNLLRYYTTNGKVERINGIIESMLQKLELEMRAKEVQRRCVK